MARPNHTDRGQCWIFRLGIEEAYYGRALHPPHSKTFLDGYASEIKPMAKAEIYGSTQRR